MRLLKNIFTWHGCLGRTDFCAGMLGLAILSTAVILVLWPAVFSPKTAEMFLASSWFVPSFFALWLFFFFVQLSLFIRRFHDIGKSGENVFWVLVPFVGIYFIFILFFRKGLADGARIGPDGNLPNQFWRR